MLKAFGFRIDSMLLVNVIFKILHAFDTELHETDNCKYTKQEKFTHRYANRKLSMSNMQWMSQHVCKLSLCTQTPTLSSRYWNYIAVLALWRLVTMRHQSTH